MAKACIGLSVLMTLLWAGAAGADPFVTRSFTITSGSGEYAGIEPFLGFDVSGPGFELSAAGEGFCCIFSWRYRVRNGVGTGSFTFSDHPFVGTLRIDDTAIDISSGRLSIDLKGTPGNVTFSDFPNGPQLAFITSSFSFAGSLFFPSLNTTYEFTGEGGSTARLGGTFATPEIPDGDNYGTREAVFSFNAPAPEPSPPPVPEPSTLLLLSAAAAGTMARQWRRHG